MFPKPSFEDWKNKAIADLKGKDFDKSLTWLSNDGIPVQPIYTDVPEALIHPIQLQQSGWQIIEPIKVVDAATANEMALTALQGGATSILFDFATGDIDPQVLLKDILLDIAQVYLKGYPKTSDWTHLLKTHPHALLTPLTNLLDCVNQGDPSSSCISSIPTSDIHLHVDAAIFKESGGSIVHEIGYAIASLQEHLHLLTTSGRKADDVRQIIIKTAVGNHYFFEIAKIRALRKLAEKVIEVYGEVPLKILSSSANIHVSGTDTHTNILRLTTAAMSAVLGKSDGVMLEPFEETLHTRRITRNIHHLLMEESHFHQFSDPAAGSYYISHLTKNFMDAGWQTFLEIEHHGGYIASMERGIIQEAMMQHRSQLEKDIAIRKGILLGVNQFPNLSAPPLESQQKEVHSCEKGLQPIRLAEPFERLRLATERHMSVGHPRPLAFLLKFGNSAISNARAAWSLNFLGCAGIASMESSADLETAIKELHSCEGQIVVLCSDNDSWSTSLPELMSKIPENTIKILAGKGDVDQMDACIHEGCDALKVLGTLLENLGIKV